MRKILSFDLDFIIKTEVGYYCCGPQEVACPGNPSSKLFNVFVDIPKVQVRESST